MSINYTHLSTHHVTCHRNVCFHFKINTLQKLVISILQGLLCISTSRSKYTTMAHWTIFITLIFPISILYILILWSRWHILVVHLFAICRKLLGFKPGSAENRPRWRSSPTTEPLCLLVYICNDFEKLKLIPDKNLSPKF
jgi:hypothetical protein